VRLSLLSNPFDLVERLAIVSKNRRRRHKLRGSPAAALDPGHIDSLELLELLEPFPPGTIYDVGANIGTWTCLAKSLFPAGQPLFPEVLAFLETHGFALRALEACTPLVQTDALFLRPGAARP